MSSHLSQPTEDDGTVAHLGAAMRYHRVAQGVSLRGMARQLGFSGHGHLVDYERGRRLPCREIVTGYERSLRLPAGELVDIHCRALAERAGQVTGLRGHDGVAVGDADAGIAPEACPAGEHGSTEVDRPNGAAVKVRVLIYLPQTADDQVELEINVACDEDAPPP